MQGCDYCMSLIALDKSDNFYIEGDAITEKKYLYGKHYSKSFKVLINYCPMCGKNLKEEK